MKRRTLAALAALALAAVALTGCSMDDPRAEMVDLPDGRDVMCVFTSESTRAGVSCDWDNAQ